MSLFKDGFDWVDSVIRDNVEFVFGNWPKDEGIGSSDVSCVVRSVIRDLGADPDTANDTEVLMIRNAVNNMVDEVLAGR